LIAAHEYSQSCHCDKCQLAITLEELSSTGIEFADCRWLMLEGLVEHLTETTYPGDKIRSFRPGDAILSKHSAFMLTPLGIQFLRCELCVPKDPVTPPTASLHAFEPAPASIPSARPAQYPPPSANTPRWESQRQELWFGGKLVKQFRFPSANQVTILAAFQEDGWPSRIDDPLPCHAEIDSRRRLNDTIRSLNRSRIHAVLRFAGDGSGEGILWEPTSNPLEEDAWTSR
jgi:hypothetical protein